LIKEAIASVKQTSAIERSIRLNRFTEALARAGDVAGADEAARLITLDDFRRDAMAAIDTVRRGLPGRSSPEWKLLIEIAGRLAHHGQEVKAREILTRAARSAAGHAGFDRHDALLSVARAQLRFGYRDGARRTLLLAVDPAGLNAPPEIRAEWVAEVAVLQARAGDAAGVEVGERLIRDTIPKLESPSARAKALAQLSLAHAILGDRARAFTLLKEGEWIAVGLGFQTTFEDEVGRASREKTPIHVGRQRHNARALVGIAAARWGLGDVKGARDSYREALGAMDGHNRRLIVRDQAISGDAEGAVASAQDLAEGARIQALEMVAGAVAESGDLARALKLVATFDGADARLSALLAVAHAAWDAGDIDGAARALSPIVSGRDKATGWFLGDVTELQVRLGDEEGAMLLAQKQTAPLDRAEALLGVAEGIMRREQTEALKATLGVRE
jgi:hypothetical protein